MDMFHATMAAPRGLPGGDRCPAQPVGIEESGGLRQPGARGVVFWAVVMSVLAASAVAFAEPLPTSYIYGIDDNSKLWVMTLSGTTGTAQELTGVTTGITSGSANGLAYDSTREQLFAVNQSNDELYWWQQGAPTYTSLGSIATFTAGIGKPVSAAYYNNAYWFLGNGPTGNLLGKLDLTYTNGVPTGVSGTSFTIVGMSGTSSSGGGDMVITPAGMLYAYSAPGLGNFFSVDVTTAASGTVGGHNLISTTPNFGLQLALGVDDTTLYGHDHITGEWFTVDTFTGNTTLIPGFTTLPTGLGFNDLGGSSLQAVPEPSTFVMAAIGGGVLFWQTSRRRRRRRLHGTFRNARNPDPHGEGPPCEDVFPVA